MDKTQEKQALETKLAQCHELAQEFRDGPTADMIPDIEAKLQEQMRKLED